MQEVDVVIVGAGAAGIGAGMALRDRGLSFVILEAADRVGGRAFTDTVSLPVAWDQGCHWMHSANLNPLVAEADRVGATYLREAREGGYRYWWRQDWLKGADLAAAGDAVEGAFDAIYQAAGQGLDVPVSQVVRCDDRYAPGVRHILQLMAAGDPEDVSAAAYGDYNDTSTNWPVLSGYGDLVTRMAAGLPVRTGTPVRGVAETAGGVRVSTDRGDLSARAAILTVSTNVLRADAIRLTGTGAQAIRDFAEQVPCGSYEKVAVLLRGPVPELEKALFVTIDPVTQPPVNFQIAAQAPRLLIAHLGGSLARALATEGAEAMKAYALERLKLVLGSAIEDQVEAIATTGWEHNPHTLGAYSAARPGFAQARRDMIAADTGRIALAGEALSLQFQATAHGAWSSGQDVARRVTAGL
ncbi:MAG: FAD-binding protein [Rhodobacteraceae bacterium]|nr:MAG: FAD-binding protein [Paracoccaceae bacterium]